MIIIIMYSNILKYIFKKENDFAVRLVIFTYISLVQKPRLMHVFIATGQFITHRVYDSSAVTFFFFFTKSENVFIFLTLLFLRLAPTVVCLDFAG